MRRLFTTAVTVDKLLLFNLLDAAVCSRSRTRFSSRDRVGTPAHIAVPVKRSERTVHCEGPISV